MTGTVFRKWIPPGSALFDVHANALPPGVASPPGFDGPRSLEALAAPEISRAVVGPPAMVSYARANAALRAWAADTGERFLPMARVGGDGGPRPIREAWQARAALCAMSTRRPADIDTLAGFAAIKLTPSIDGLPARSLLAEIRRRKLPVLVHAGAMCPPAWLAHHLLPHLEGPLILAHLGSWPCAAEALRDAVALAVSENRVYLETSGASIGNFVAFAARNAPHKLLFGSSSPMCPPAVQWAHVAAAVLEDAVLERIAWRNASDVFGF